VLGTPRHCAQTNFIAQNRLSLTAVDANLLLIEITSSRPELFSIIVPRLPGSDMFPQFERLVFTHECHIALPLTRPAYYIILMQVMSHFIPMSYCLCILCLNSECVAMVTVYWRDVNRALNSVCYQILLFRKYIATLSYIYTGQPSFTGLLAFIKCTLGFQ